MAILFWSGVCSAVSYLIAVPIAERVGLTNALVFTYLPSNVVPFAPDPKTAIAVGTRSPIVNGYTNEGSYVMAVVRPHKRLAAAGS